MSQMNPSTPIAEPCAHANKNILITLLYAARNLRSGPMFRAMKRYSSGHVLDIGGLDFFNTALEKGIPFTHWTTVEPSPENVPAITDPRFTFIACDGCDMKPIASNTFDTVFCIQVVEHVMEPNKMMAEISRVLKPGGHVVLLAPQTSTVHMYPQHYYNFTRMWVEQASRDHGLEIVELTPLGGRWSSIASNLVYFLLQAFGMKSLVIPGLRRSPLFYLLLPVQVVLAVVLIPVCMILSLGDLPEEPNNHLLVAKKR